MVHNQPKSNLLNKPKSDAQTNNPSTACFWFALPPKFVFLIPYSFSSLFFNDFWYPLSCLKTMLSLSSPHVMLSLSTCFSVVLLLLFIWFMTCLLNRFEVHIRHISFLFFAYLTCFVLHMSLFYWSSISQFMIRFNSRSGK
jgi:hypothetical protein